MSFTVCGEPVKTKTSFQKNTSTMETVSFINKTLTQTSFQIQTHKDSQERIEQAIIHNISL